jgi:hypothetical protein
MMASEKMSISGQALELSRQIKALKYPTKWDSKLTNYINDQLKILIIIIFTSLDSIRAYTEETIVLEMPGERTIFEIDWISIFDVEANENFGSILIADGLNVPPSLTKIIPYRLALPNCKQLHKDLQVQWEVFGPAITMLLSGKVSEDDYMAFGLSGSDTKSQMLGADVAVTYIDGHLGYAIDYHIDALASCVQVLGVKKTNIS